MPAVLSPTSRIGLAPWRLGVAGDERLARLVAKGDERAFRQLYDRYHQPLYRYCRSLLQHEADAQDALQGTFTSAFTALRSGRRDAPMRPWLFRIAHNESISVLRRRRPEQELTAALEPASRSLEERVEERQRLALLMSDLRELPERQRGALVMRELSGLSHEEIALAMATSVNAAKQTIFEARKSLTEFAEGRAMACDEVCRLISDADGRALRSRRVRAHLRECSGCAAFAAAIPERGAQLRALAPPLPAIAAGGILARVLGGGSTHGGSGTGLLAAGAGKGAGSMLAAKAAAVAVAATAAVGATAVVVKQLAPSARADPAAQSRPGNRAHGSAADLVIHGVSVRSSAAGQGAAGRTAGAATAGGWRHQHARPGALTARGLGHGKASAGSAGRHRASGVVVTRGGSRRRSGTLAKHGVVTSHGSSAGAPASRRSAGSSSHSAAQPPSRASTTVPRSGSDTSSNAATLPAGARTNGVSIRPSRPSVTALTPGTSSGRRRTLPLSLHP